MSRRIDITGMTFGRLTVVGFDKIVRSRCFWNCKCECGNNTSVFGKDIRNGHTKSCGCIKTDGSAQRRHGYVFRTPDGKRKCTKVYKCWLHIKDRCLNPKNGAFKNYGGRGITICNRWKNSFEAFLQDMGEPPSQGHSIDRINNNGGYEPGNCRWATRLEQNNNRREYPAVRRSVSRSALEFSI